LSQHKGGGKAPMSIDRQFQRRAGRIPKMGLGLSVDVYSPDLWDLMNRFDDASVRPSYLEIFRAPETVLKAVRQSFTDVPLTYHGEGLWVTQPEFRMTPLIEQELADVASELDALGSSWLNHECAAKQMGGYSFGTYLPPLYTLESAYLVAENIGFVQERLDRSSRRADALGPLFLLEMAPLTYFMAGTLSVAEYFRLITERTPCGLVLDIGHLWTVYRYSAAREHLSVEEFVDRFLDVFPMERIIEIHIAGLAAHESDMRGAERDRDPEWIDAHAAEIPAVSWAMLEQVLAHPRLRNLRAVALEVDTKPLERIVEEFRRAVALVGPAIDRVMTHRTPVSDSCAETVDCATPAFPREFDRSRLETDYVHYAQIASGQRPPAGPSWSAVAEHPSGLERYIRDYLPHEILHWGGDIAAMFPETCAALAERGIAVGQFVPWWVRRPRPAEPRYDFFLLKIDRFMEFVAERAPGLSHRCRSEGAIVRAAYEDANTAGRPMLEPCR
jgi:uncharacterized protein (UPF0276 family)